MLFTTPIRRNRRPCTCCGQHRPHGYLSRGKWRASTELTICWRCFKAYGDVLRAERLAERANPIVQPIPETWPKAA